MIDLVILYAAMVAFVMFAYNSFKVDYALSCMAMLFMVLIPGTGQKLIEVGGLITNVGNINYAAVMFCMSLQFARHGAAETRRTLNFVFFGFVVMFVLRGFASRLPVVAGNESVSNALTAIFGPSLSLAVGSFLGIYISMSVNLYLLARLTLPPSLRKPVANVVAQAVDSAIFFPIAFAGQWTGRQIATAAAAGFAVKSVLNILDTPLFLYLANQPRKAELA